MLSYMTGATKVKALGCARTERRRESGLKGALKRRCVGGFLWDLF